MTMLIRLATSVAFNQHVTLSAPSIMIRTPPGGLRTPAYKTFTYRDTCLTIVMNANDADNYLYIFVGGQNNSFTLLHYLFLQQDHVWEAKSCRRCIRGFTNAGPDYTQPVRLTWSRVRLRTLGGSLSKTIACSLPIANGTGIIGRQRPVYVRTSSIICRYVNTDTWLSLQIQPELCYWECRLSSIVPIITYLAN